MTSSEKHGRLYLVCGDSFFREKRVSDLIQAVPGGSPQVHRYHAWGFNPSHFIETAQTYPLLAPQQFLILKGIDSLTKSDKETLVKGLVSIPLFSTIILESDQIDQKDVLCEWARDKGKLEVYRDLDKQEKDSFISGFLKNHGKTIRPDALELLQEFCGGDLELIKQSLNKLVLHAKQVQEIDSEAVIALCERGGLAGSFDLVNAISGQDAAQTLKVFNHLCEIQGEEPVEILGMLNWHFKRLWRACELLARRCSPQDIARELRIPPYFLNQFIRQAKRFSRERLWAIFRNLFELDWKIKLGMVDPKEGLEIFLIRFCHAS